MKYYVRPIETYPTVAVRWLPDGSNWREVLDAMGTALDEHLGMPTVLIDWHGDEFAPGSWYVPSHRKSYTDEELRRLFEIVSADIEKDQTAGSRGTTNGG